MNKVVMDSGFVAVISTSDSASASRKVFLET